jgi:hypothetical protein
VPPPWYWYSAVTFWIQSLILSHDAFSTLLSSFTALQTHLSKKLRQHPCKRLFAHPPAPDLRGADGMAGFSPALLCCSIEQRSSEIEQHFCARIIQRCLPPWPRAATPPPAMFFSFFFSFHPIRGGRGLESVR